MNPYALTRDLFGYQEFHLDSDWLVIYQERADEVIYYRTGTHLDLFSHRRR